MEKDKLWTVFSNQLNEITSKYKAAIHAFVLMDNHYHLILSTNEKFDLGKVMCEMQKNVSRIVNSKTLRTNHVFGGPFKGSLIENSEYYFNVFKYVFRNPVESKLVERVLQYEFSSLFHSNLIKISRPNNGIDHLVPYSGLENWLDKEFDRVLNESIKKGLRKTQFKFVNTRKY